MADLIWDTPVDTPVLMEPRTIRLAYNDATDVWEYPADAGLR